MNSGKAKIATVYNCIMTMAEIVYSIHYSIITMTVCNYTRIAIGPTIELKILHSYVTGTERSVIGTTFILHTQKYHISQCF